MGLSDQPSPGTSGATKAFSAILITDIVGSTHHLSRIGNDAWRALLGRHDALLAACVAAESGQVLRSTGDGALCLFGDPQAAIRAALALHAGLADIGLQLRIGIHLGEVERLEGSEIAGLAVHVAARIADCAKPGETLVSGILRGSLLGGSHRFVARGSRSLRGVPGRWPLFLVGPDHRWERAVRRRHRIRYLAVAVLVLATLAAVAIGLRQPGVREQVDAYLAVQSEQSIGVLPLIVRSSEATDVDLAVGLAEEMVTQLAKIGAFRIVEAHVAEGPGDSPERIGRELGVRYLLKGRLERQGEALRIRLSLVSAQDGSHVWAESYDRGSDELLGLQTEVARGVAQVLRAQLSEDERQQLAQFATLRPEAYDAYLKGLAVVSRGGWGEATLRSAREHFEEAVRLDPDFALAWAQLATVLSQLHVTFERSESVAQAADLAARRAAERAPGTPETLIARANYVYLVEVRIEEARRLFAEIDQRFPGRVAVKSVMAVIAQDQGRWDDAVALFEQSLGLDPQNRDLYWNFAFLLNALHRFSAAHLVLDRALRIFPDHPPLISLKANALMAQGRLAEAETVLATPGEDSTSLDRFWSRILLLDLQRRHADQLVLLQSALPTVDPAVERFLLRTSIGRTLERLGRHEEARALLLQARQQGEALLAEQTDASYAGLSLALVCALLGDREAARHHLQEAGTFFAVNGTLSHAMYDELAAEVETVMGDHAAALARLTSLRERPTDITLPLTAAVMRLDPRWDALRSYPAFEKALPDDP